MKKAIVSVTNDISTDQRVHRTALALQKLGYEVLLVGRRKRDSKEMEKRSYRTIRMNLWFEQTALFYANYNLRLFFFLLFRKADLLFANDLDTLLPNYLVSKIRNIKLVYDAHEYYTGTPELSNRPMIRSVWKTIEKWIFPKLNTSITVSDSIAKLYGDEYGKKIHVVRNVPLLTETSKLKTKSELGIPGDKKIILYQGAGINIDRGLEEMIDAMKYIENAVLLIVGSGDVISFLKKKVSELNLKNKVTFKEKVSPEELKTITPLADIALTLDKNTNINYRFSLPNKLFDYIHAGVPVLASSVDEVKNIVAKYRIGTFIESHAPEHIAEKINSALANTEQMTEWKNNCKTAAQELNWQHEEKILLNILTTVS